VASPEEHGTHDTGKDPISVITDPAIGQRSPVLAGVLLSIALVAVDATILSTAVPAVVGDLGGFAQFPWLFSVYLLAQAISTPLYGKFADTVGRKPMILLGIALFTIASVLCGATASMTMLIAFRALQGLGAGALQSVGMTIIGDLYSVTERGRVLGYLAAVWAAASVIGPTLGGAFSQYLSWRWIFFVNVPLGIVAALLIRRTFTETVTRTRHRVDYAGAILLTAATTLLILAILEGGVLWAWTSPVSIIGIVTAVVFLAAFVAVERRAREPILPLWVLSRRTLNGANGSSLLVGLLMVGLTSFIPLYAQVVLHRNAVVAGLSVAAITIGWPLASATSAWAYMRIGLRGTALIGAAITMTGTALLLTVSPASTVWLLASACFVIGIGLGYVASPALIAAQASVGHTTRGVVTAANLFARAVGSALGVSLFGAIVNHAVTRGLGGAHHTDLTHLPSEVLAAAIHATFLGACVSALLLTAAVTLLPTHLPTEAAET
jgi:EmrB/QacA subfamily drug resistance transporter